MLVAQWGPSSQYSAVQTATLLAVSRRRSAASSRARPGPATGGYHHRFCVSRMIAHLVANGALVLSSCHHQIGIDVFRYARAVVPNLHACGEIKRSNSAHSIL